MSSQIDNNSIKKLSDCKKNCLVKVINIDAQPDLKQRLFSFGIMKGAIIEVLQIAPAKSTIEIKIDKVRVALRAKEAELIEVQKYEQ